MTKKLALVLLTVIVLSLIFSLTSCDAGEAVNNVLAGIWVAIGAVVAIIVGIVSFLWNCIILVATVIFGAIGVLFAAIASLF